MRNNELGIDQPVKLFAAEIVAREVIKMEIREQIAEISSLIRAAKEEKEMSCRYDDEISEATKIILEKAGYDVEEYDDWTEISWESVYDELTESEDDVIQMAQEAGVHIITLAEYRNRAEEE